MTEITRNNEALKDVEWTLDQAYKLAVKLRGVKDWTNDFKTDEARDMAKRDVEKYQLEIAKFIEHSITSLRYKESDEKFDKRMEESDKKFDERYGVGDKKEWGSTTEDKRDTDDIGKV